MTLCGRRAVWSLAVRLQPTLSSSLSLRRRTQHSEAGSATNEKSALSGIKVLDLSRILAGPFCTMVLGDMGAEVIKVEKPGDGDDARAWGPPWVGNESCYFLSVNRNKKSIAVNIKSKEGAQIIKELATKCDVLVENYMPGKLSEYGLGYEQLHQLNPALVYASLSGFGQTGPYVKRGGFDNIAIAIGGLMNITGPEDGEPCRPGVAMIDVATGLYAVGAITSALLYRQKTSTGQHVQCNLLSTQVSVLTNIASNWLNCQVGAKRLGTAHPSIVPYQAFKTKGDGRYIMFGAGNNKQFKQVCQKLGLEHLTQDERYGSSEGRLINKESLLETISDRIGEKSLAEWLTIFEGASFPYGPVNSIQEVFSDPQVLHNNSIQEMTHSSVGKIRLPSPAMVFSESPTVLQYPPPALGQHTFDVLRQQLHYDDSRIHELEQSKIIEQN